MHCIELPAVSAKLLTFWTKLPIFFIKYWPRVFSKILVTPYNTLVTLWKTPVALYSTLKTLSKILVTLLKTLITLYNTLITFWKAWYLYNFLLLLPLLESPNEIQYFCHFPYFFHMRRNFVHPRIVTLF